MMLFADSAERKLAQAVQVGSVVAVLASMLVLINFLDHAFTSGYGGLRPVAMERTLGVLNQERTIADNRTPLPCDATGTAAAATS
jgi:hypothetical protein